MKATFPTAAKKIKERERKEFDVICKTVDKQELKSKIEIKLQPLFLRLMSAKHEKSTCYINKAIAGQLETMPIANRVRQDYLVYQRYLDNFVELLEN